jgi:hypothetical protein
MEPLDVIEYISPGLIQSSIAPVMDSLSLEYPEKPSQAALRVQHTCILERVLSVTFAPMVTFGLTVLACLVLSRM